MLIRFAIENFRSYKEESSLLLTTSSKIQSKREHTVDLGQITVLKFAGIYGDNASGKTNVLKAVDLAKNLICYGIAPSLDFPFFGNEEKPTKFDFVFSKGQYLYHYAISIKAVQTPYPNFDIVEERLDIVGNGVARGKEVYSTENGVNPKLHGERDGIIFDIYLKGYSGNERATHEKPFLSFMNEPDRPLPDCDASIHLSNAFSFFKDDLSVLGAGPYSMGFLDREHMRDLEEYCAMFDPSIESIRMEPAMSRDIRKSIPSGILNGIVLELFKNPEHKITLKTPDDYLFLSLGDELSLVIERMRIKHRYIDREFLFSQESEGTKKFLILMSIFSGDNQNKVFFLDEIESSMHPSSSLYILDFFERKTEGKNTQFVFTTHDTDFMRGSLRRDEVYFADKDVYGQSFLYSLTEFQTTDKTPIEKKYLEGAYRKISAKLGPIA